MSETIRNAIIMAAGTSSRFVPLSYEIPKGLLEVKGEVLIERQIRQLREAGISDITIVVGYMADKFQYLKDKFGVTIVLNEDYSRYNNTSSLIRVVDKLGNTYVCSSDNYFPSNVFLESPDTSYYSALYASGETKEYCIQSDESNNIKSVAVGGRDSWYMIGHVYFSASFSKRFKEILIEEYKKEETKHAYWEDVYIKHLKSLPEMKIHRYKDDDIKEFDSIDELRIFDNSYVCDTRSSVLKEIASMMKCSEADLSGFVKIPGNGSELQFLFSKGGLRYSYCNIDKTIVRI